MRIFQFSDTHLGHQQFTRTSAETGLNQREQDGYDAFHSVIETAVREKPDVVIHAGDLFDGVRPSNRALAAAMDGFLSLSKAGIPMVLIAGNHEHPKMRETGSPFRLFEHLDGVHAVYRGRAETIEITNDCHVHAVPQCADQTVLAEQVQGIDKKPGQNILILHGSVQDLPAFRHAEFNELSLNPSWFEGFDHVALGHYHGHQQVAGNAWYCGATERVSMAESGEEKGFLDIQLGGPVTFRTLPGRPYADLPIINAEGLDAAELLDACQASVATLPRGCVARLRVENVDETLRGLVDVRAIHTAASHTLHLDLRLDWTNGDRRTQGAPELGPLVDEFEAFAAGQTLEVDRAELMERARGLLVGVGA